MFLLFLLFLLFIELVIFIFFKSIKKNFQWILSVDDILPDFNKEKFKSFLIDKFSFKLGWDYKNNKIYHDFNDGKKITLTINKKGYRGKIIKKPNIAVFGDSYAICRQVEDKKTWENQINIINKNIRMSNYGVGNYGFDQAVLKYQNSHLDKSVKKVIICVVPETISRIQCQWKHVIEHGNVNAFKPRFEIRNNKLILKKNLINSKTNLSFLKKIVAKNVLKERFYNERLMIKVFKFPFLISFLKNLKFNLLIFYTYFFYKIFFSKNSYLLHKELFKILYKNNIFFNHQLYKDYKSTLLFQKIIYFFRDLSVKRKHEPILIIIPQKYDLISKNKIFYLQFFKKLEKEIKVINLTDCLLGKNNIYIEDKHGGHLNSYGNYLVAKYINKKIY
jgi:hypothetical protein